MHKVKTARLKALLVFALFAATGIAYILMEMGGLTFTMAVTSIFSLLWFIRKPRPDRELPNSSVSCCHYLGDDTENQSRQ